MKTPYNAAIPPSETPVLPGVVGIMAISTMSIWAANDSKKNVGFIPRPKSKKMGIDHVENQNNTVIKPARRNVLFPLVRKKFILL